MPEGLAVEHCARNTPTSHRMTGTRVPSGCSAAALRHHSTRLPMSSQEWGDDSGAEVPASSRRSSMALASLQEMNFQTLFSFNRWCTYPAAQGKLFNGNALPAGQEVPKSSSWV